MVNNTVFEMKTGQTAAVLDLVLSDAQGPVDLSDFEWVKLTVRRPPGAAVIDAEAMTADADQSANPGKATFAFTTDADITPGVYNIEIKAQDGSGKVHYFPVSETEPYGKLVVLDVLA